MPDEPQVESPAPPPEAPPAAPPTPEQEEAALDTLIAEKGVDIPGDVDGRLVPLAAVTALRGKLKDARTELAAAKAGGDRAAQLEAEVLRLQGALAEAEPLANAYKVFSRVTENQPPAGPTPEDTAELEEIARDEDYYKTDGTLDTARAERHRARIHKAAEKIAQAHVAPIQQQTAAAQSKALLSSAKMTKAPNGMQPDPAILDELWGRLPPEMTAKRDYAIQVWNAALGMTMASGKAPAADRPALPTPLVIEKAGGRDAVAPAATAADQRAAKDLGMSVEAYMKEAADMPAGWGKG